MAYASELDHHIHNSLHLGEAAWLSQISKIVCLICYVASNLMFKTNGFNLYICLWPCIKLFAFSLSSCSNVHFPQLTNS